jgi:hypothetical protein
MGFVGGSAYGMAREIGEGYHLVTERTLKQLLPSELDQLAFELDRQLRDLRGQKTPLDDVQALQKRNRRLQRLNGALVMLNGYRQRTRRPR